MRRQRIMRLSLQCLRDELRLPKDVHIVAMTQTANYVFCEQVSLIIEGERFPEVPDGNTLLAVNAVYRKVQTVTEGVPEFVEFIGG